MKTLDRRGRSVLALCVIHDTSHSDGRADADHNDQQHDEIGPEILPHPDLLLRGIRWQRCDADVHANQLSLF